LQAASAVLNVVSVLSFVAKLGAAMHERKNSDASVPIERTRRSLATQVPVGLADGRRLVRVGIAGCLARLVARRL
jgi:hypothetical protein